jgi:hypothetical protein
MTAWKSAGRASRGDDEALWERLKAAQDQFFTARNAVYAQRDAAHSDAAAKKHALAQEAEKLLPIKDLAAAKAALRNVQDRWEAAGEVARNQRDALEQRLRAVEKAIREADQAQWNRSNPERKARANSATTQLREAIDKLAAQLEKAKQSGDARSIKRLEEELAAKNQWLEQVEKYV